MSALYMMRLNSIRPYNVHSFHNQKETWRHFSFSYFEKKDQQSAPSTSYEMKLTPIAFEVDPD